MCVYILTHGYTRLNMILFLRFFPFWNLAFACLVLLADVHCHLLARQTFRNRSSDLGFEPFILSLAQDDHSV
ncbi:hypothetical protein B0H11DRAFT_1962786, partial [Mycena galericulata]